MHKQHRFFLLAPLLVCVLSFLLFPSAPAHAMPTGRLFGSLLDGTQQSEPVAGQRVTLQTAQNNTIRDLRSVKTDAQGRFAFTGLETGKTISYAVSTTYQGAHYTTNPIDLSTRPVQQLNLTVYEATTSSAGIATAQAIVVLDVPEGQTGVLIVSEYFFFENAGMRTYVGSLSASRDKPNALRFSLPPGARHLSLNTGFDGTQVIQGDRDFATDAALPPGITRFAFSFEIPYTTADDDVPYAVVYPTQQLSVLVPANVRASSSTLSSLGLILVNQRSYHLFQAKDLLAGTEIHTQLAGLPVANPAANSSTLNPESLWLVMGLLILLALLCVTGFVARFPPRPASAPSNQQKHAQPRRDVTAKQDVFQNPQRELFRELFDLDRAFEAGKIRKAEYRQQRAKTKAQLRALMGAGAAGRQSGAATRDDREQPIQGVRARKKCAAQARSGDSFSSGGSSIDGDTAPCKQVLSTAHQFIAEEIALPDKPTGA